MRSTVITGAAAAVHFPGKKLRKVERRILRKLRRFNYPKLVVALHPHGHQGPNKTALNRYPEIFAAAAAVAPSAQRILSFGCSTGEECVTLAEYFPNAQIIGTDINPLNLLKARKHRSERIRFVYAADRVLRGFGGFDAVFCMAVFRPTWKHKPVADAYPFDRFAERALFLESLVRPGGLLVIHGATYRFGDTAHQCSYETVPVAVTQENKIYLPDGATQATLDGCIFRKLEPHF